MNPTRRLHDLGQSLWLDNITRGLLQSGTLAGYIRELAVTGLTPNPTIFDHAIKDGDSYDEAIRNKAAAGRSGEALFFDLALEDLEQAADLFRPVHDATGGKDGWVSLEVSPLLADAGARPQRLLWVSTGTKDAAASNVLYIETLAAPETINTMPQKTLLAFAEHGKVGEAMRADAGDAEKLLAEFARAGVDNAALAMQLQREGTAAFAKSWRDLLGQIAAKVGVPPKVKQA